MTTAITTKNNSGFVMLNNDLMNIEKINGKSFTGNMKIVYSLIIGFTNNGQEAYFSQDTLKRQLGTTRQTVVKLIKDMVDMGLINKTGQISGGTCRYTVNPITPEMVKVSRPTATPVEKEENAGSVNSASGHQNNSVESTAIIGNLDLDDNGPDIQLSDPVVELTGIAGITGREVKLTGANDDVCLTAVESGNSAGNEVIEVREAEQSREEKDYGDPW